MLPRPGPPRIMLTMTAGSSQAASVEIPSCLREIPGLEEEVMARAPAALAPTTMCMAATSLSDWTKTPPSTCRRRSDMYSGISFCGVIGYPAKKRHPARMAASPMILLPCMSTLFTVNLDGDIRAGGRTQRTTRAALLILETDRTISPGIVLMGRNDQALFTGMDAKMAFLAKLTVDNDASFQRFRLLCNGFPSPGTFRDSVFFHDPGSRDPLRDN